MLYLTMYRELDKICNELDKIVNEIFWWAWDKSRDVSFELGYDRALEENELGADVDLIEWLRKNDDWSVSSIVEYIKDSYGADEVLNNIDKYELLEYLYSEYDTDDFISVSWNY